MWGVKALVAVVNGRYSSEAARFGPTDLAVAGVP